MSNPDQYNETITAARKQGIPINTYSSQVHQYVNFLDPRDEAARSLVEKQRSDTVINEKKELAKIAASERSSQHTLWGKTLANITAYLIALGMFTLGGLLLYRDKAGDAERAKWLIGLSTTVIFANAGARAIRSLTDAKD